MWQLDNRTPFAADRTWTRGRDGAEIWLVTVKCTYDINPDGALQISTRQCPVTLVPEYIDPSKPGESSLKYDSDLVRTKLTTDVVVLGHAYAPRGRAVPEVEARLQVGTVAKRLRIVGDRRWHRGAVSEPKPFTKMPIVYERAYGGVDPEGSGAPSSQWDVRNPVGTGFATSEAALDGVALPNVEYPDQPVRRWDDRPLPAGFGPLCAHWQPRAHFAGTYDNQWERERQPLLPDDFDDRYYQSAPSDQQPPEFLKGEERIALSNLTPSGELQFELPRVFLGLETFFNTGEKQVHEKPRLHSVIIEPDLSRLSLVWHSALACHPKVYKLTRTRIIQKRVLALNPASRHAERQN